MKKKLSITVIICLLALKINGQCQNQSFEYKNYPGICVENSIKWFNILNPQNNTRLSHNLR